MRVVNLAATFARFDDRWSPKIVGELNGCHVKLAKLAGEFVWHAHADEDELFLVVRGRLRMRFRGPDGSEDERVIAPGEFVIVPRGTPHLPIADDDTHVVLLEPATTINTGDAGGARTVRELERL